MLYEVLKKVLNPKKLEKPENMYKIKKAPLREGPNYSKTIQCRVIYQNKSFDLTLLLFIIAVLGSIERNFF